MCGSRILIDNNEAMKISITRAKKELAKLIEAALVGQSVTICRRGVPVVDIVPTNTILKGKQKFGTLKGRIVIYDENWYKPMTEKELGTLLK